MSHGILLGRSKSLVGRESVWQLPDGLEIESKENYEVVRRRVLFEDIIFITLHRRYGATYLILTGLIALFFMTIALAIVGAGGAEAWRGAIVFFVIGLPALLAFALRVALRLDVITVYGRRTQASIRFGFRKARARALYEQIVAAVTAAQDRAAREIAAEDAAIAAEQRVVSEEQPPMPPVE